MFKIICIFFVLSISLFAQRIELQNINTSKYPKITVEVDAFDASNAQFRGLAGTAVTVKENGVVRNVTDKFCEQNAVKFSLIISVDLSATMALNLAGDKIATKPNRRYDAILKAVELLVNNLDLQNTEVALLATAGQSTVHLDFSQDKKEITDALKTFPDVALSTEINVAFIGKNWLGQAKGVGSLNQAHKAKWKPVVLFFSDGGQTTLDQPPVLSDIKDDWILDTANAVGAIIYNLNFGTYSNSKLNGLSSSTGGDIFESSDLETDSEIQVALQTIKDQVELNPQALAPCEVEFITDCSGGGVLEVTANIGGVDVTDSKTYTIPDNVKPDLLIDNRNPEYYNVNGGASKDVIINLTAQDNDINIVSFNSTDPRFSVVGAYTGVIQKGKSKPVTIRFTSDGSSTCTEGEITFVSDACSGNTFNPKAGWMNAMNVNVGSAILGQSVTNTRVAFENNTCKTLKITDLQITKSEFKRNMALPLDVPAGGTADVEFTYTPSVTGAFSSPYKVTLSDGSTYDGTLNGGGSGQAQIATTASNQPTVKCSNTSVISFDIENNGEVEMDVTSISLDNITDFTLTSPNTLKIPASEKATVNITFNPTTEGNKTANVTIVSNAGNEPLKVVAISGNRSNISATGNTFDIGVICPNSDYDFNIPITNNGEIAANVTLSTTSSDISFPSGANIALANVGGTTNAAVRINSATAGAFSADIVITDECGEQQGTFKVSGTVKEATVSFADFASINLSSNLNEKHTETIEIKNDDARPINNVVVSIVSNPGYFTIKSSYPTTISGNGSINVEVEYLPTVQGSSNLDLLVVGDVAGKACLSTQLPTLTAGTNLAEATWSTGAYSGLIGQTITLNLASLVDDNGFATSGVTDVKFDVIVDSRLLEGADGLPDAIVGFERTIKYTYNVASPKTIKLKVLDPSDVTINSSSITITNASTVPVGRAIINSNNGTFNLIRANGKVNITDYSGKTGDATSVVITGNNLVNVDANFHQKIKGELKVNASILVPRGSTPQGRLATELGTTYRYVPFSLNLKTGNPKLPSIQATAEQAKLDFYVTLGDAETTTMELVNLSSEVGVIDLASINIGNFLVTNVCKNEAGQILMLWKSNPNPPIIMPNPISNTTEISVNAYESGNYIIGISDASGNIIKTIYQGALAKGEHKYYLNPQGLSQGSYYINVISPSERFDKSFIYIK